MSLDELNKIDIISTGPDGDVWLTIADHYEWQDLHKHLLLLQDKINAYLQFVEDGEIYEQYPGAINNKISINTVFQFEPPDEAIEFLEKCSAIVNELGLGFNWKAHRVTN